MLFLTAWVLAGPALAGPTVEVAGSAHRFEIMDQHQSPRPYAIWGAGLQTLVADSSRVGWFVEAVLDAGSAAARGGGPSSLSVGGRLSLGVTPTLWRSGGSVVRLGAAFSKDFHYVDEIGYSPWAAPLASVDVVARLAVSVGPGTFRAGVALPVVGAVTRHVWSLNPVVPGRAPLAAFYERGTSFVAVPHLIAPRAHVTYAFGERPWQPHIGVDVGGFAVPDPAPVRRLRTRVLLGLTRALGGAS